MPIDRLIIKGDQTNSTYQTSMSATSNSFSTVALNGAGDWLVVQMGQGDSNINYSTLVTFLGLSGNFCEGGGVRQDSSNGKWEARLCVYSALDEYYDAPINVDLTTFVVPRALLGGPEAGTGDIHYATSNIGRVLSAWHLSQNPIDTAVQRAVNRVAKTEDPDAKAVALLLAGGEDAWLELPKDTATRVADQLGVGVVRDVETGSSIYFHELS